MILNGLSDICKGNERKYSVGRPSEQQQTKLTISLLQLDSQHCNGSHLQLINTQIAYFSFVRSGLRMVWVQDSHDITVFGWDMVCVAVLPCVLHLHWVSLIPRAHPAPQSNPHVHMFFFSTGILAFLNCFFDLRDNTRIWGTALVWGGVVFTRA